jgi:Putative 2OG-Fe(II) oxygenase
MSEATSTTNTWQELYLFPTCVYKLEKPEFVQKVKKVSQENLNKTNAGQKLNEIYPVKMSSELSNEPELSEFSSFVLQTGWNILDSQGYFMEDKFTVFESMWMQEHHKMSVMEQHGHGFGIQLVGFYFLDTPDDSSRVLFYDPRPGKVQINLPEKDPSLATPASQMINFEPKPGDLFMSNAWLNHSFSRNANKKPFRFIHFNITLMQNQNYVCPTKLDMCVKSTENVQGPEII